MSSAFSAMPDATVDRSVAAAAIMASHQRERLLGPVNPAGVQSVHSQQLVTGQVIPPSYVANPEVTVNASISSDPTPVLTGDGGGAAVFGAASGTGAATVASTVAGSTTATANPTLLTPTTAASTISPGMFAAGPATASSVGNAGTTGSLLTPTISSAAIPSPNVAATSTIRTLHTTATTTATSTTAAASRTASGRVVVPIRVITNQNGTVMVTNVATSNPSIIKSK